MAGSAVITTSASRAVMKKATDVSASAQPAGLLTCMSPPPRIGQRCHLAPADCPTHLSYGRGGPKSTAADMLPRADFPNWRAAERFGRHGGPAARAMMECSGLP